MKLLDYARPLADAPTLRMPAIRDPHEHNINAQLVALFSAPVRHGYIPGTTKTYAEEQAEQAAELLADLHIYRAVKYDTRNKIRPKRRRWIGWR